MRMRYRYVAYRYREGSQKQLELHYRQLLNDALRQQQSVLHRSTTWRPPADILESPEKIRVKVELAGMNEEDIEVTLYEDALVISGERRDDHEYEQGLSYHEAQIRYGPFRIEVYLPASGPTYGSASSSTHRPTSIVRDAVSAHYENGILSIDLPKASASTPERIPIQRTTNTE
jgi:HSP20 family protein